MRIAWIMAGLAVAVLMLTNGQYGYFRDELYYLALSDHLAAGYVDLAPLVVWITRLSRALFGDSLHAIRLVPALAFGGTIVLTGLIAREMGGRGWGTAIACISTMLCPVMLANGSRLAMNALEPLFWMGCVYVLLLAINRNDPKLLVWCGVLLGLGLENKHSTVFFLGALVVGLAAASERSERRFFATKWFWIAASVAFLIALPNVVWQYLHHFPTLEDLQNVKRIHKNVELPPIPFLIQQVVMLGAAALVWIPGFVWLLKGKRYRFLGVTYLAFLAVMMVLKGKDYYLAPIYPMLFAAGGVCWESAGKLRRLSLAPAAVAMLVLAGGIVTAPIVLPILPPEKVEPYMAALGIKLAPTETGMRSRLPQYFADEFGWPEMVDAVARVYNSLPPEQRARTAILARDYGGAGAPVHGRKHHPAGVESRRRAALVCERR